MFELLANLHKLSESQIFAGSTAARVRGFGDEQTCSPDVYRRVNSSEHQ